jgi:hypothetical protein
MNSRINLLGQKKQTLDTATARKIKVFRTIAMVMLFGVSALSIILFILIAVSPLPALKIQEQQSRDTLANYHPDIAKLALVDDRLRTAVQVLNKRPNFDKMFDTVKEKMPSGIVTTGVSIDGNSISLTVSSPSLSLLDTFLNNLMTAAENKRDFSKVTLASLYLSDDQTSYIMTVTLVTL